MASENFDIAVRFVLNVEGGYSNHRNDRGGQTNYGITNLAFKQAKRQGIINSSLGSVKDLTIQDAKNIYKSMFWDKINGDALPANLALVLFDMAVNSGGRTSVLMLQQILGVQQDGVIGSQTLVAIDDYRGNLIDDFLNARENRYRAIVERRPDQGVFLKGWLNRVKSLRDYVDHISGIGGLGLYDIFRRWWAGNSFQNLTNAITNVCKQLFSTSESVIRRDPLTGVS